MDTNDSENDVANLRVRVETINRNMVFVLSAVVQTYVALSALAREVGVTEKSAEELRTLSARIDDAVKKMSGEENG